MNKKIESERARRCAWCNRTKADGVRLFGPRVRPADPHICNECLVQLRMDLFDAIDVTELEKQYTASLKKVEREINQEIVDHIPKPDHVKRHLDKYVVAQEYAKKSLAVALYNHLKIRGDDARRTGEVGKKDRLSNRLFQDSPEMSQGNVLLLGPTGSGKTLLIDTLARCVNVPFVTVDATTLTDTGYVGEDAASVIHRLYRKSHAKGEARIEEVEHGIVYIDEIDKLTAKQTTSNVDHHGTGVQDELLKLIEGTTVSFQVGNGHMVKQVNIDTSHILFIGGGAFPDLEQVIGKRQNAGGMGFLTDPKEKRKEATLNDLTPSDIMEYGFSPEFIGRFQLLITLDALTREDLLEIMTEPKNAIVKEYQKLFGLNDCLIEFDTEASELIADHAIKKGTGARGLRTLFEKGLLEYMYHMPDIEGRKYLYVVPDMVRHALHEIEIEEKVDENIILFSELSKHAVRR